MNKFLRLGGRSLAKSAQWVQLSITILFGGVVTALLLLGIRDANELQAASSALQLASQLSTQPDLVAAQLTLIQRGLETTTYIGGSLRTLTALRDNTSMSFTALGAALRDAGLNSDRDVAGSLRATVRQWQRLAPGLDAFNEQLGSSLYVDTPTGSELSAHGNAMKSAVDRMLATQSQSLQNMSADMNRLGAVLRAAVDEGGLRLRALLVVGSALAGSMLALMLYYAWRSRLARRAAAEAERQVANILSTVREGLFLIDRDMQLSATYSDSLGDLLHLPSPAGLPMQQLLEPLVDAKTLNAALKYLGLLWKDKVHEELIESVNPLSQIEVSFANARGGTEVRYLAFSFRRVRSAEAASDYILGVVADVTDRVLLARELESVKAEGDSQAALQLQLLRADPEPLRAFLGSADVALRKSNAVLTAPGIEQEDLKKKLQAVFRELHAVKGEASALALQSFVQRIHLIEDALSGLRNRPVLTGNDFLPVVVRLDELINHLSQIGSMQERIATLRALNRSAASDDDEPDDSHRNTTVLPKSAVVYSGAASPSSPAAAPVIAPVSAPASNGRGQALTELLRNLTLEVARSQGRAVRLVARGMDDVPAQCAAVVKDICIQMIRNSVTHGIEPPEQRIQRGKTAEGTVQINFAAEDTEEYSLTIEDDGHGLNYEQIVDKALRLDLISPQQAMALDRAGIYRLIFQPGFSTSEEISEHAGRGVGLDAVSTLVREQGGKIGVSTAAGKYTRFRVLLPRAGGGSVAASTAA